MNSGVSFRDPQILYFDTETTGLPGDYRVASTYPYPVQLSWLYGNLERNLIIKPEGWEISEGAVNVHGISQKTAQEKGLPMTEVMQLFLSCAFRAKVIVAHNVFFDCAVISKALHHLGWDMFASTFNLLPTVCTMEGTTEFCDLPGPYGPKWPKLEELHTILFGKGFEGAHNALYDVRATKRCHVELMNRGVLLNYQ